MKPGGNPQGNFVGSNTVFCMLTWDDDSLHAHVLVNLARYLVNRKRGRLLQFVQEDDFCLLSITKSIREAIIDWWRKFTYLLGSFFLGNVILGPILESLNCSQWKKLLHRFIYLFLPWSSVQESSLQAHLSISTLGMCRPVKQDEMVMWMGPKG